MIGLELKQKSEEHTGKKMERRGEEYCLRGEGVSSRLCCSPTARVWAASYQDVRWTFPIG